jgi:RNA polymerase sigma-70 factor (ECF subfamily)
MFLVVDGEQFRVVYRRYGRIIFQRCERLLHDREHAEDATQEVFLKLAKNLEKLNGDENYHRAWIYRVATFHCIDVLREMARRQELESAAVTWDVASTATGDTFAHKQLAARVLAKFGPKTQAIAIGVLVDGMEQKELARVLGISERTISRQLEKFLVNARKFIDRSDT